MTQLGTPVIIADAATAPAEVLHPGLLWNAAIEQDIQSVEPGGGAASSPAGAEATPAAGPVSILISGANQELYALQNGVEVITSPVTIADLAAPLGTHIFVLAGRTGEQERWHVVSVGKRAVADGKDDDAATAALKRVEIPKPGLGGPATDAASRRDHDAHGPAGERGHALGQGLRDPRAGPELIPCPTSLLMALETVHATCRARSAPPGEGARVIAGPRRLPEHRWPCGRRAQPRIRCRPWRAAPGELGIRRSNWCAANTTRDTPRGAVIIAFLEMQLIFRYV